MLLSVGEGTEVCLWVGGKSCFGIWLGLGDLAEATTGCRQGVGLWGLLRVGMDVAGVVEGGGVGGSVGAAVGFCAKKHEMDCVGVWEGVAVRMRAA